MTPPPTYTGNPPILVPNGYDAERILGGLLNFDENMSPFKNTACAFCHMPYAGFSGPIPSVNLTMVAYPGTFRYRAAKRTAQRYTYSHTFPVLKYNTVQGLFFGGNFWDGRATGYKLQAPDAEQAQRPPVDPLEMGIPIRLASRRRYPRRRTGRSLSWCGARISTSVGRATLPRSAPPPMERSGSAGTPRRSR